MTEQSAKATREGRQQCVIANSHRPRHDATRIVRVAKRRVA